MQLDLKGANVAIAGASRGIGLSIAQTFFNEGAKVWLTGRNEKDLQTASKNLGEAPFTVCDLEQAPGRENFFTQVESQWKHLDALILNVGSGRASHPGLETPLEEWQRVFNLNLFTHTDLIRRFQSLLRHSKIASIVSVSSIAGQTRLAAPVSYSAAKAALDHFCVSAAQELAAANIRFNTVAPGNVYVPGGRWDELLAKDKASVESYIQTAVPMKRFAKPQEIANFVVFLASPAASFCTGSTVRVDGGQTPL